MEKPSDGDEIQYPHFIPNDDVVIESEDKVEEAEFDEAKEEALKDTFRPE